MVWSGRSLTSSHWRWNRAIVAAALSLITMRCTSAVSTESVARVPSAARANNVSSGIEFQRKNDSRDASSCGVIAIVPACGVPVAPTSW